MNDSDNLVLKKEKFERNDLIIGLMKFGYSIDEANNIIGGNVFFGSESNLKKVKENLRKEGKVSILEETILGSLEIVNSETLQINKQVISALVDFEKRIKELEVKKDEIRVAILDAMVKNDIDKFENDEILITYVKPTKRESFDSKKFKEDHPDFYEDYVEKKLVSASVRIKVK